MKPYNYVNEHFQLFSDQIKADVVRTYIRAATINITALPTRFVLMVLVFKYFDEVFSFIVGLFFAIIV